MALRQMPVIDPVAPFKAHAVALGPAMLLVAWDEPATQDGAGGVRGSRDGRALPAPVVSRLLTVGDHGRRLVVFRNRPDDTASPISFRLGDRPLARWAPPLPADEGPTMAWLAKDLAPAERARLAQFLLHTVRTLFRLDDDAGFAVACRHILAAGADAAASAWPLAPRCRLTGGLALASAEIAAPPGPLGRGLWLGAHGVAPLTVLPGLLPAGKPGKVTFYLPVAAGAGGIVVFPEAPGAPVVAFRPAPRGLPNLLGWLETRRDDPVRDYLAGALGTLGKADPQAAAAARELQLCLPLKRRRAATAEAPVGGDVELAVGAGAGGLFLAGWLNDPHDLIEALEAVGPDGRRRRLPRPVARIPRPEIVRKFADAQTAPAGARVGFVLYAPGEAGSGPELQYRFAFRFASGASIDCVAPPQPTDLAAARAAVLASVPIANLDEETLERCIAPAAAALHARHMASRGPATGVGFGTPPQRPAVSAIIPLYRNLDFLRFQLAAFAIDTAFAGGRAELIFVLDSPEQREMVEHILTGLHGLYGLPMRLVVMPRNYGYAAANNAGAGFARGERLLFLNSDVVPERPGWLETLDRAVTRDPAVAAAGAKLLFDDDSLQHAGLYFGRDWRGRWINRHFHKGLPRRFPAACRARSVPAVTGACLLMRRAVFEAVGGFTEDYIIGDYEDSDLCLKARAAGWDIVYEPAAELYHLERQSIEQHTGYSRGVASEYNCWLHGKRWGGVIARLMGEEAAEPDRADGVRDGGDWDGAAGTALTRAVA